MKNFDTGKSINIWGCVTLSGLLMAPLSLDAQITTISGSVASLATSGYTRTGTVVLSGRIPGDTGVISAYHSGVTYAYADHVIANVGFMGILMDMARPATNDGWALLEIAPAATQTTNQRFFAIGESSANITLNLDHIIFANTMAGGNNSGGALTSTSGGGSSYLSTLTLGGDMIFLNNIANGSGSGGAALFTNMSVAFSGSVRFDSNKSGFTAAGSYAGTGAGGAVRINTVSGTLRFAGASEFLGNKSGGGGGAIIMVADGQWLVFDGLTKFQGNTAGEFTPITSRQHGGAISMNSTNQTLVFNGTTCFTGNHATGNGGGISFNNATYSGGITFNSNACFNKNIADGTSGGGAIQVNTAYATTRLLGVTMFDSNTASGGSGGAINMVGSGAPLAGNLLEIKNDAVFTGNYALNNGGAVAIGSTGTNNVLITTGIGSVEGIAFTDNKADAGFGGAIYFDGGPGGSLALSAQHADITFTGNVQGAGATPNDIYFNSTSQTLAFDVAAGRGIFLGGGIANKSAVTTTVTKTGAGTLIFDTNVSDIAADTAISAGVFRLLNNATYGRAGAGSFTLAATGTLDGAGTVLASQITLNAGSTVRAASGGVLSLMAGTLMQTGGVKFGGNGAIDAGANTLIASDVAIGDIGHALGQTLTFAGAVDLGGATIHIGLFPTTSGTTNDKLAASSATITKGATTFDFSDFINGAYAIINTTGALSEGSSGNYITTIAGVAITSARLSANYTSTADSLGVTLNKTSAVRTWDGASGAIWDMVATNWSESDKTFLSGDAVSFTAAGGPVAVAPGGVLASGISVNSAGDFTFTGGGITTDNLAWQTGSDAAADGRLTKDGTGTLTFANGANNFKNGIEIKNGVLAFSNTTQIDTINTDTSADSGITFAGSGTLRANTDGITIGNRLVFGSGAGALDTNGHSVTYAGLLGGSGTFAKVGNGVLTLVSAANSAFAGATAIRGGSLVLDSAARLGGITVIETGGTLAGTGSASGVSVGSGGALVVGMAHNVVGAESISIGSLTLAGGTVYLDTYGSTSDWINAGSLAITATSTFDFSLVPGNGAYALIVSTTPIVGGTESLQTSFNGSTYLGRTEISYAINGGTLSMVALTGNAALFWQGGVSALWNTNDANWTGGDTNFRMGDIAIFDSTADAANTDRRTITVAPGGVVIASGTVTGPGAYVFTGGAIITSTNAADTTIVNPSGKFTVDSTGLVVFQNTGNSFAGGLEINSGTVLGTPASLGNNTVMLNGAGASLNIDMTGSSSYNAMITGAGSVNLVNSEDNSGDTLAYRGTMDVATVNQDAGNLALDASGTITAGAYNQNTGWVQLNSASLLRADSYNLNDGVMTLAGGTTAINTLTIGASGTLRSSTATPVNISNLVNGGAIIVGKAHTGGDVHGSLTLNGNYTGNGGVIALNATLNTFDINTGGATAGGSDQFIINGNASGRSLVNVTVDNPLTGGGPTGTGQADGIKVIIIRGANTGSFELARRVVGGVFDYGLVAGDGGMYLQAVAPSPEIPAASSLPAMAVFMGQTALDGIVTRMGEIRFDPENANRGWWIRDSYNNTGFDIDIFPGARVHTNVIQFGYDRTILDGWCDASWTYGACFTRTDAAGKTKGVDGDFGRSVREGGSVENGANGFGLYALMQKGAWYADATIKADNNHFKVTAPNNTFASSGWNVSGVVETGYTKRFGKLGTLEPQLQAGYQAYRFSPGSDYYTRTYAFETNKSLLGRIGVRWHGTIEFADKTWLIPWLRVSGAREFLNSYGIAVRDAAGVMHHYENDMRGNSLVFDGGLTWGLSSRFTMHLNAGFSKGDTSEGMTIGGGVRYIW
jgi:autotransporter-associated beta strand protein